MKATKNLRKSIISGLLTLVMAAAMFVCMGKLEAQAATKSAFDLNEGDILQPGDIILGDGAAISLSMGLDANRETLEYISEGNLTIKDSYNGNKISKLIIKYIDKSFEYDGYFGINVENVADGSNAVPTTPAVPEIPAATPAVPETPVVETPAEVAPKQIGYLFLKEGDFLNPGDYFDGGSKNHFWLGDFDTKAEYDQVTGVNLVIKDSYNGQKISKLEVKDVSRVFISDHIEMKIYVKPVAAQTPATLPATGPKQLEDGTLFDAVYYATAYPDVAAVLGTDEVALYNHYVSHGKAEGRLPNAAAAPSAAGPKQMADGTLFDAVYYASTYPDVAAVFGTDEAMLYNHYVLCGKAEGRLPYAM